MSTALKEFLQQQAKKHHVENRKEMIEEWKASVGHLFEDIRAWLKESDPENLIEIDVNLENVREPGLGRYQVQRLDLHALGKWIGIIPKARKTVGAAKPPQKSVPERAAGRVDITDELRRYVLYRLKDGDRDLWMIDGLDRGYEEKAWPGEVQYLQMSEPRPLDQEAFEKALMSYLR